MASLLTYIAPVFSDPASLVVHFYTPSMFSVPSSGSASIYLNVFPSALLFGYYGLQMGIGERKILELLKVRGVEGELQVGFSYPVYFSVVLPLASGLSSGSSMGYSLHASQSVSLKFNEDARFLASFGWYSSFLSLDLSAWASSLPVTRIEVDESSFYFASGGMYRVSPKVHYYMLAFYAPTRGRIWFSFGALKKLLNVYLNLYPESPLQVIFGFSLRFVFR